jgi:hypothetical protein
MLSAAQKDTYDLYDQANGALQQALSSLNQAETGSGPYKALAEKAKPWLTMNKDKKYSDIRDWVELGQAQIRKGYYGTAVTNTEAGNANQFLIIDSDNFDSMKWKIENASAFLEFVNDSVIAQRLGLPHPELSDYLSTKEEFNNGVTLSNNSGINIGIGQGVMGTGGVKPNVGGLQSLGQLSQPQTYQSNGVNYNL